MIALLAGVVLLVAMVWLGSYADRLAQTARGGRNYRFPAVSYYEKPIDGTRSLSVHQNLR